MRYLKLADVLYMHRRIIETSGGSPGVRNLGVVESALAQPKATYGGEDLNPSLLEKASSICFSLIQGHPFVDGNKRVAHAALEVFLLLNGAELVADVDEQERMFLRLASGEVSRDELTRWLGDRTISRRPSGGDG